MTLSTVARESYGLVILFSKKNAWIRIVNMVRHQFSRISIKHTGQVFNTNSSSYNFPSKPNPCASPQGWSLGRSLTSSTWPKARLTLAGGVGAGEKDGAAVVGAATTAVPFTKH